MSDDSVNHAVDEDARRRFESAWQSHPPARLAEFLPPSDSHVFLGTLEELVQIELEFCWKNGAYEAGAPPLVEAYLRQFPQLADPEIARRLVHQEYRVRHRYGDRPAPAEYAVRFPVLFEHASNSFTIDPEPPARTEVVPTSDPASTIDGVTSDAAAAKLVHLPGYDVLKILGRGGMGLVLQARDSALNRMVAIKLPLAGSLRKSEADRFQREARSAAKLRHPNICPIYQVGEHHGRPYIAMGYVDGPTLQTFVKEHKLNARQSAEMIAKIARAVAYAYEHGVIHRDIKPANVLIESESGEPILTDFGLAKETTAEESLLTQDGTMLGTPMYMSPEQAASRHEEIGPQTDVYSLGAVLYELLCGRPPYLGSVGEILWKLQSEPPPGLRKLAPKVHRDLETVCMKALAQEPKFRYATARAFADDLDRFNAGEAILARRDSVGRKVVRTLRRHPREVASIALILVLAVSAVWYFAHGSSRTRQAASLHRQIESRIDAGTWNAGQVAGIDALIGKLADLDPQQADAEKAHVTAALAQSIDELLRRPTLSNDILARLNDQISLYAARAPDRATAAREMLRKRERVWETLYDLKAPFANLSGLPDSQSVRADHDSLIFSPPPELVHNGYAPLVVSPACVGNVQLEMVLEKGWTSAQFPVLVLGRVKDPLPNLLPSWGYAFKLEEDRGAGPEALIASCSRNNIRLRTWDLKTMHVRKSDLGDGTLRMTMTRENNRLTLQLNELPPLVVDDLFATSLPDDAAFGVYLPAGSRIRQLRAVRQSEPIAPSALEQGDALFNTQRYADALAFYQKQAIDSTDVESAQETRYKQALCQLMLKNEDAAASGFGQILAEEGKRWPALAGCQLLTLRMHRENRNEGEAIFRTLRGRFSAEFLNQVVPEEIRTALLRDTAAAFLGLNMFGHVGADVIENAKQGCEFSRLLTEDATSSDLLLVRSYELAGQEDQAIAAAEAAFAKSSPNYYTGLILEDYCAMMAQHGHAAAGLDRLNRIMLDPNGDVRHDSVALLVDAARLHAAMNDPAAAKDDVQSYMKLSKDFPQRYIADAQAAMIQGFLREEEGDAQGAKEDWRYATFRQFAARHHLPPGSDTHGYTEGLTSNIIVMMSGAFADDLSDADVQMLIMHAASAYHEDRNNQATDSPGSFTLLFQSGAIDFPPSTLRDIWRTPRGHRMARQIVFRALPLGELARQALALGVYQYLRQGCTTADLPPDQDEVFWEQSRGFSESIRDHKLSKPQILKLYLTWNGTTNFLGWGGVEKSLEKSQRAGMAYIFGKRFLFIHKPADAEKMFRQTLADAPADSPLHLAAEGEIQGMGKGEGK